MLKEYLAAFGIKVDDAALGVFAQKIDVLKKNLTGVATLAAGAFVAKGALDLANEVAAAGDEIGDTATKLQVSTDSLQEWRYVLQLSGAEAEAFDSSIRKLNLTSAQAATGSKEAAEAYAAAGVELYDANKQIRASEDLFEDAIINLSQMEDTAKRNAAASRIFGRNYSELLGVLDKGADGVAALRQQFRESGGMFSAEDLKKAGEYDDALLHFDATLRGLKITIGSVVIPVLTWLVTKGGQVVSWFTKLRKTTSILETGLVVFGAVAAKALLGLSIAARSTLVSFAPFALQALIFLGLGLAIEDLITTFQGGESVIRDFIDGMFGEGKTQEIVDNVKEIADTVSSTLGDMGEDAKAFAIGVEKAFEEHWLKALFAVQVVLTAIALKSASVAIASGIAAGTTGAAWVAAALAAGAAWVSAGAAAVVAWLPFILTAAVITAAIWGIIYVVKNWERISSDFAYFWNDFVVANFLKGISAIHDWWVEKWDAIRAHTSAFFDWCSEKIDKLAGMAGKVAGFFGFGGDDAPAPPGTLPELPGPRPPGGAAPSVTNNTPVNLNVNQTISGAGSPEAVAARANKGVAAATKEGASRATWNALVPVR